MRGVCDLHFLTLEQRTALLAHLLRHMAWSPGNPLPPEVDAAYRARFTVPVVDLLLVREGREFVNDLEVLLFRRNDSDAHMAGKYAGVDAEIYGHEPVDDVLRRIMIQQLGSPRMHGPDQVWGGHQVTPVGPVMVSVYFGFLLGDYHGEGAWFRIDRLPASVPEYHRFRVNKMVEWLQNDPRYELYRQAG